MIERIYKPMLLTPATVLPDSPEWSYEPKLDGWRVSAAVDVGRTVLRSRSGNNISEKFPDIVAELPEIVNQQKAVLDGELVGLNADGTHSFGVLRRSQPKAVLFVFDLLELNGTPIYPLELQERRLLLDKVMGRTPDVTAPKSMYVQQVSVFDDRDSLIESARSLKLEGVVAKRRDSLYWPGKRSTYWRKQRFPEYRRDLGRP